MRAIPSFVLMIACAASPALAQSEGPAPVSWGGDIGIFAPFESGSGSSFTGRFTADVATGDRLGLRFAAGFANPTLGGDALDSHADLVYVSGGVIQRLGASSYRPYVHGGVGIYHLSGDRSGTDVGLSLGSGFELRSGIARTVLTPELTAHLISGDAPRFSLALTVGLHTRPR